MGSAPLCGGTSAQRALRDILMSRGKTCLPTVSRQFLTRKCPDPNCLLKCLPNCLSPTREGFFASFKINPRGEGNCETIERQNCLEAIFDPRHQDVSSGPLGARSYFQRTPWGGWKKRGVENLTNDAHPKKEFWTPRPPPRTVRFPHTLLRCQCSVVPVQKSTTEQTRSSLEGSKNFLESAFSGTFPPPPIRFAPPHITAQYFKVARLQSEFCTKDFIELRIFLRKMLRNFPRIV